jgi:orotidine-5'-phosphate decarboxylase
MSFKDKLKEAQRKSDSWLCVGLDPVLERLPADVQGAPDPLLTFGRAIVEHTADLVCAYKPNLGFWLAEGAAGLAALEKLIAEMPRHIPVILDGKFNDVGHTAQAYARAAYETFGVDAVTANPYLGLDTLEALLSAEDRGVFLLARTSNPSAPDLQDLSVDGSPLYQQVARLASGWDEQLAGTCGLVVGATYPQELGIVRDIAPRLPFLIPGIGAQGGDLEQAVLHGASREAVGPVINSSRGIIYASSGPDFAEAARDAALATRERINRQREASQ